MFAEQLKQAVCHFSQSIDQFLCFSGRGGRRDDYGGGRDFDRGGDRGGDRGFGGGGRYEDRPPRSGGRYERDDRDRRPRRDSGSDIVEPSPGNFLFINLIPERPLIDHIQRAKWQNVGSTNLSLWGTKRSWYSSETSFIFDTFKSFYLVVYIE